MPPRASQSLALLFAKPQIQSPFLHANISNSLRRLIGLVPALVLLILQPKAHALTEGLYTYEVANGHATITDFGTSHFGTLQIPETLGGCPVTSVGQHAFSQCSGITALTLPTTLTTIAAWSFSSCGSFTYVNIPASVTNIGENAFDISSLKSISVDAANPVYSSCQGVLFNKDGTTLKLFPPAKAGQYIVPEGVTNIANLAFCRCFRLTAVEIPDSVIRIGNDAFYWNTSLNRVSLGHSVATIGSSAFIGCRQLTRMVLPSSVTSIGGQAFASCSHLESISLPSGLTIIRASAFSGCSALTSINIPPQVRIIDYRTFSGCTNLYSIKLGKNVTTIERNAFDGCARLASIVIPDKVTSINGTAFNNCKGLVKMTVGAGVANIARSAFLTCTNLSDIYFLGNAPATPATIFSPKSKTTVHYLADRSGWGPDFCGRPTEFSRISVLRKHFKTFLSSLHFRHRPPPPKPRSPPSLSSAAG